jgi:hypothetical protein
MRHRQPAVAAAFAAVILASLLLVRPRGPAVAPRAAAASASTPASAPASPGTRDRRSPLPPASPGPRHRHSPRPLAAPGGVGAATAPARSPSGSAAATPAASNEEPPPDPATQAASAPRPDPRLTGAVTGTVRGSGGEAIPGTTILAVSADGEDAAETTTDDEGAFLVPGLRPGRYALFAGLGTAVASRVPGRGVEVGAAAVTRVDLLEPAEGTVIRVSPHDARGRPAEAQAVLVSGPPSATGTVGSLLASDAIYLPELGGERTLLPRVPPGVYTLVLLQGAGVPVRAARDAVRVSSERELVVRIEVASAAAPRG